MRALVWLLVLMLLSILGLKVKKYISNKDYHKGVYQYGEY